MKTKRKSNLFSDWIVAMGGWPVARVAKELMLSRQTIYNYIDGRTSPAPKVIKSMKILQNEYGAKTTKTRDNSVGNNRS
jgi:IS30 family transposase